MSKPVQYLSFKFFLLSSHVTYTENVQYIKSRLFSSYTNVCKYGYYIFM